MALVRGDGEGALGTDAFDASEGAKKGDDGGIQGRGAGFAREKGGSEVVGDGAGQDDEVGPQAVEGVFEALLDGLAEDEGKEDGGSANGDGGGEEKDAPGTAAYLLQKQTQSERDKDQAGAESD